MTITLGLVANIYNEVNALPGWLETHLPFFDDVRVTHSGPNGEYSNDGTIELLEKWKIPVNFDSINDGFGAVRTRAIHRSPCDYVMILDADERFYANHRILSCTGESTPHDEVNRILQTYDFRDLKSKVPNWDSISKLGCNLQVISGDIYDQGSYLRSMINDTTIDAIISIRRHWHDFSLTKPTQNWHTEPDWQMRTVKNIKNIHFDTGVRMHERLQGASNIHRSDMAFGPFFDHFHFTFKRMEEYQRAHDVAIYDAIHEGRTPPTIEEFKSR